MSGAWSVERAAGCASDHHGRDLPSDGGRHVWVHEVDRPALVLGSTQPDALVDREAVAAAGVEVVRRRSGGGAVLVERGGVVWIDVVVPPGDPLWDDDVGRAMGWVGEVWAAALAATGVSGATVHRGRLVTSPWSGAVCFGGLGPGEVTVDGQKVVGVAQRRTRRGARFQTAALLRWQPEAIAALLCLEDREAAAADLGGRARGLDVGAEALVTAFLDQLTAGS